MKKTKTASVVKDVEKLEPSGICEMHNSGAFCFLLCTLGVAGENSVVTPSESLLEAVPLLKAPAHPQSALGRLGILYPSPCFEHLLLCPEMCTQVNLLVAIVPCY